LNETPGPDGLINDLSLLFMTLTVWRGGCLSPCFYRIEGSFNPAMKLLLKGPIMTRPPPLTFCAGFSSRRPGKQNQASLLSLVLLLLIYGGGLQELSATQNPQSPTLVAQDTPHAQQTSEQLQRLVAPIALYPDSLVAQILAASTYPEQVVQADRWVQAHPMLKGEALGKAVDQQPWDPSVKALAAFPSVLGNMDKNLSWTSSLGDAYFNQQQDVMDAVQLMRRRAQGAGNLKTTPQQTITAQDSNITIEPANPEVVYVPEYDPWSIYGLPLAVWPGWYEYPGIWFGGSYLSFGIGFGIGFYGGFEWGWPRWGFDWHNRGAVYNNHRYRSQSRTFYNRNNFYRGSAPSRGGIGGNHAWVRPGSTPGNRPSTGNSGGRSAVENRPGETGRTFRETAQIPRWDGGSEGRSGVRSGAFSGYQHGGQTRGFSSRGSGSLGGGGARGGGGHHR
jgi:Protein of unknown function (DUF3300)